MSRPQIVSAIHEAAAEFVNRESNRQSLITVTKVEMDERGMRALVFISIFPDSHAKTALDFLQRRSEDLRTFIKKRIKVRVIPQFTFMQDPNIGGLSIEKEG